MSSPTRTIALMNQKGGVGKTTTTVNLAAAVARSGRRVLVIDLDPQAHASLHLGVDNPNAAPEGDAAAGATDGPAASVYDVLLDPTFPVEQAVRQVRENLWLLPAETDLAALETELADIEPAARTTRLRAALEKLSGRFDFIFIDCPPSLGVLTLNGLAAAREVFIPMQAHFLALQGVSKLLETVALVAKTVNPRLRVTGVILCMHDTSSTHTKEVVQDLADFFEQARASAQDSPWKSARVLSPAIRRNIKLAECPSFGQTIYDYAPFCPGALDYKALAERLIGEWDELLSRLAAGASAAAPAASAATAPAAPTPEPAAEPVVRSRKTKAGAEAAS
jgi:chromosome partitioning protein